MTQTTEFFESTVPISAPPIDTGMSPLAWVLLILLIVGWVWIFCSEEDDGDEDD